MLPQRLHFLPHVFWCLASSCTSTAQLHPLPFYLFPEPCYKNHQVACSLVFLNYKRPSALIPFPWTVVEGLLVFCLHV